MRRLAATLITAALTVSCGSGSGPSAGTDTAPISAPSVADVLTAMSAETAIAFDAELTASNVVILLGQGVLDPSTLAGHRVDQSSLTGSDLEQIAEVWLENGELFERVPEDDSIARPVNGGLATFLGVSAPPASSTFEAVLSSWIGADEFNVVGPEVVGDINTINLTVDREERGVLELWVDAESRIVMAREIDDGPPRLETTHRFDYEIETATIPTRPPPS